MSFQQLRGPLKLNLIPYVLPTPPGGGGGSTGQIKVYLVGVFTPKPVKVWNGGSWVIKPLKVWNGSSWVVTNY